MWIIYETKTLNKVISKLPKNILKQYELWKRIVELEGGQGLKLIKGYRDESLKGTWEGHRSSRLNQQWRVIYKMNNKMCEVYVIDINAHDYRRR